MSDTPRRRSGVFLFNTYYAGVFVCLWSEESQFSFYTMWVLGCGAQGIRLGGKHTFLLSYSPALLGTRFQAETQSNSKEKEDKPKRRYSPNCLASFLQSTVVRPSSQPCNPATVKAEAGEYQVQGLLSQCNEILSQKVQAGRGGVHLQS